MNNLIENKGGHGAIPLNPIHRKVRKLFTKKIKNVIKGLSFDWNSGYDVRNAIGQIVIKNQGDNSSCGGQAGSYFLEIQRKLQHKIEGDLSAKSIYSPIAYPGGGTTITALMTQTAAHGATREAEVLSYDMNGNPLQEYAISDKSWMTPDLISKALTRAGYTPYDIGENIDIVAQTIQNYGAVIWEIRGQNNGTWTSAFPTPPVKTNTNDVWNHFMCAIGAKMINGKKYIIALQSQGSSWGDNGIQYFGEDYFNSGNIVDCFTFIYDTQLVPDSGNFSVWASITRWFEIYFKSLH